MTVIDLYPPIGAATVVFILWALVEYRLYKRDLSRGPGQESMAQILWLLVAPASLIGFYYFHRLDVIATPVQMFFAALVGIMMGALGVFSIKQAFFTRHEQARYKVISVFQMGIILALVFVLPFTR